MNGENRAENINLMRQQENEAENRMLAEVLTPPRLNRDLTAEIMNRLVQEPVRQPGWRCRLVWLTAASLVFSLLLGWWFISGGTGDTESVLSVDQVLVETAHIGRREALVIEFAVVDLPETRFFWFDAAAAGGEATSGEET